ncbi:COX assembly mitochondrial protein homolog [Tribolium castaneum]|uniref:COX assembly mitochondrial protein n=1 Tax=Tribolium castaneum TaxID=7070 RepID=D6WVU5_TRICA|nr:PREDICTED: COX assembly mitochondrial protein homolog [Tribolium castaneum]EFA08617.1 COX assembly mitochondrial protein homolog-like Protein [Tribolium castaneum]|eukprot:XP_008196635.1 PREDICTED: COX assembly mitochondrial protein homolog [Tribolium castaneum]
MANDAQKKNLLHEKYASGPHGLGDPNDRTLRRVEIDVMIPKKMREIARDEKCTDAVEKFTECCKNNNILMTFMCRKENAALKECLTRWYEDEDFKNRCKEEYLNERSEYRRTGVTQKQKQRMATSM